MRERERKVRKKEASRMLMSTCFDAFSCILFLFFFHVLVFSFYSLNSCQCLQFSHFIFSSLLSHTLNTMQKTIWAIEKYIKYLLRIWTYFDFRSFSLNSDNISRRCCIALANHQNGMLVHELFGKPNGGHFV